MAQAAYQPINQLLQTGQARENYAQQALQAELDRFNFQQNLLVKSASLPRSVCWTIYQE